MFVKRALVTIILLPIGIAAISLGGWYFAAVVAIFMVGAAWEYGRLFHLAGLKPADGLIIVGALLLLLARALNGFEHAPELISLLILVSLTYHLVAYERGSNQSGTEFGVTLGGIFYLGWIGAYLISLRSLPDGKWWVFLVLPSVWFADIAAYMVGSRFGKHKMIPRLSPKKSWEGYFGGVIFGTLLTVALAAGLQVLAGASSAITPLRGLWVGLVMSILPTLGDLGESMIKRQAGAKDSSNLIPGHGGFFDRVDSWLWAGVLGYYLITYLWL
jgi:phosphatidate cytidylyltransferase